MKKKIWYLSPAKNLHEALPAGNGRIGAMVYGGTQEEKIQIDESTFWSGEPSDENTKKGTYELCGELRELLMDGKLDEADLAGRNFVGNKKNYGTNLPVGNLELRLILEGEITEYYRDLDMETAVLHTNFKVDDLWMNRELFVSNPDSVMVVRMTGERCFGMEIDFKGIDNNVRIVGIDDDDLLIEGEAFEEVHSDGQTGVKLRGRIRILSDGQVCGAKIKEANCITLLVDMRTTMFESAPDELVKATLDKATVIGYEELKDRHIRDYAALFSRVDFQLKDKLPVEDLPTDKRIWNVSAGRKDIGLDCLLFHYGRYLLIASSREDSPLPTHMGGVWNDNIYCRADCTQDIHIDMNVQMQYLLANSSNLTECAKPLWDWINQKLLPSGMRTAKEAYKARGFVGHVVSNAWGFSGLGWAYNWGVWAMGGTWLATMAWLQYKYTCDEIFLKDTAYPIIKNAALFAVDYLFRDKHSEMLMSGPSYSPENHFGHGGKSYCLSISNTCDILLIREIFENALEAAKIVGDQDEVYEEIRAKKELLPPYKIGSLGQLQEWFWDFDEIIPGHRHTSHLLGFYPYHQIQLDREPELSKAVRVSVERRQKHCEITSWTMALFMSYYARLRDGEQAYVVLQETIRRMVKPSLISCMGDALTMWDDTWELDGNTGLTSAISEMLIQVIPRDEEDILLLLPALPQDWPEGEVTGIRAEGGIKADMHWADSALQDVFLYADYDTDVYVRWNEKTVLLRLQAGKKYSAKSDLVFESK